MSFVKRRDSIWKTALIIAIMFGAAVVVSLTFGGVPTWQKHGENAGPSIVRFAEDPYMYCALTLAYSCIALVATFLTFYTLPWIRIGHVRMLAVSLLAIGFALVIGIIVFAHLNSDDRSSSNMDESLNADAARVAWSRIESLGGHGVWDNDMVAVSLNATGMSDDDLSLFADLPHVQILDISSNPLTDAALKHLDGLRSLESLNVGDTDMTEAAIAAYRAAHPNVEVQTERLPPTTINPFTGEPIGE